MGERIFDVTNALFMAVLIVITIWPFWSQVVTSLSGGYASLTSTFWPKDFSLDAYKVMLNYTALWRGLRVSLVRVVLSTVIGLIVTILTAYPLSKKKLPFNKLITFFVIFTMLFNGGMIPTYLALKKLNMLNTIWALVLPGSVTAWNILLMRNFFMSIPESLEESARIDGASHLRILFSIIMPLSTPIIATIGLFIAVAQWNEWFNAMMWTTDPKLYVLQYVMRRYIEDGRSVEVQTLMQQMSNQTFSSRQLEAAMIIVSVIPMLLLYPFIQKYFTKGIMVGAVKG